VTQDAAAAVPDAYVCDPTPATDAGPSLRTGNVDRRGRAGIAALLVHGDDVARDAYERESTYQAWPLVTRYDALFERNLEALDALDGKKDWDTDGGVHPLRAALLTDVLVVDTSITCSAANGFCASGYLEIERERLLGAPPHATCGGRTPNDDVMDRTLTLLVAGPGPRAVTDGGAGAMRSVRTESAPRPSRPRAPSPTSLPRTERTPSRRPMRSRPSPRGPSCLALRGHAPLQLDAHQIEAGSLELPRATEEEERVMNLRVVGRLGRAIELVAIGRQREGRAQLVAVRSIEIRECLLEGDAIQALDGRSGSHPFTSLAATGIVGARIQQCKSNAGDTSSGSSTQKLTRNVRGDVPGDRPENLTRYMPYVLR
jgi:hypothetical protein